jgi:2-polyprenyl-3-methyl-5-hydroxy-6-metoxy-1,4-benzoquinol methylase
MANALSPVADPIPRTCPVCGQGESQPHLQKADLNIVRCRHCGMIYANPVPADLASGRYYDQAGVDYYLSPAKVESDYAPVRFERELRWFRKHCSAGAVLDVGCSSGAFLFQLKTRFPGTYEILGTDASGPPLDYAESRGIPAVRGDFLKQEFGQKKFAAITFWAVLEHLLEPKLFLEKAATLLEAGGVCFVLVPNMKSLAARFLGARYRYIYPQHLNYFTRRTLRKLVENRFSVIEMGATHFNPIIIWQDWRRGGAAVPNAERAQLLKRTTAYKQSRWLGPARGLYRLAEGTLAGLNLADNLVAVLRKT